MGCSVSKIPQNKSTNPPAIQEPKPLQRFLADLGLPSEGILASEADQAIMQASLETAIRTVPAQVRSDARYLSKFVLGASAGLYDYALNAIWNEVVVNLRQKAEIYGLDIFFDAAVGGGKTREHYKTAEDLAALKDVNLLHACRKLELIGPVTYKKLQHILDMRNEIGISHPTDDTIGAYELLGWMNTCITEVISDQPTEAALQAKAFITNLKASQDPLTSDQVQIVEQSISRLSSEMCANLLRTIFGMFVDPATTPAVQKNISFIAKPIWNRCSDEKRYRLGFSLENYKVNLDKRKYDLGGQFFMIVDGAQYRSESDRAPIIDGLLTQLLDAHNAWDNFHHEAPVASAIYSFVPEQSAVLPSIAERLYKIMTICRVGNGVNYCNGVSPGARGHYDGILGFAGDLYAPRVIRALISPPLSVRLDNANCRSNLVEVCDIVAASVIHDHLLECIAFIKTEVPKQGRAAINSKEFIRLAGDLLN